MNKKQRCLILCLIVSVNVSTILAVERTEDGWLLTDTEFNAVLEIDAELEVEIMKNTEFKQALNTLEEQANKTYSNYVQELNQRVLLQQRVHGLQKWLIGTTVIGAIIGFIIGVVL